MIKSNLTPLGPLKQAQAATLQRLELEQAIAGIAQRISDLAAEKSGLADKGSGKPVKITWHWAESALS